MAVKYKSRHKTALERKKLRNHGGEWRGNYSSDFDLIGISDEIRFLSLSLSLLLPFYSYTDYYQIQKYKQFVKTSAAIFQSRKCHNANFWVLDCLKDNNLQPGKIMIYFSRFQHQQRTIRMNCKMELQNFYLHCLLETWSVP